MAKLLTPMLGIINFYVCVYLFANTFNVRAYKSGCFSLTSESGMECGERWWLSSFNCPVNSLHELTTLKCRVERSVPPPLAAVYVCVCEREPQQQRIEQKQCVSVQIAFRNHTAAHQTCFHCVLYGMDPLSLTKQSWWNSSWFSHTLQLVDNIN